MDAMQNRVVMPGRPTEFPMGSLVEFTVVGEGLREGFGYGIVTKEEFDSRGKRTLIIWPAGSHGVFEVPEDACRPCGSSKKSEIIDFMRTSLVKDHPLYPQLSAILERAATQ